MPTVPLAHVLSVDDDVEAGEMLGLLLRSYGVEVTSAASVIEAWPLIGAQKFDLFLLDAWLPKVDGFELCRQIRASDPRTPILFYSGAGYAVDIAQGFAAGANAYIVKPDLEHLIEAVNVLITPATEFAAAALSPVNTTVSQSAPLMFRKRRSSWETKDRLIAV